MSAMTQRLIASGALLVWFAMAWFLGRVLGLKGTDAWILRIGLALIGAAGAALILWMGARRRKQASEETGEPEAAAGGSDEYDLLLREAEAKLAASRLTRAARIGELPLVYVMGAAGSIKTSTMLASGIEAELLSGAVHQDNRVIPTRALNVWLARGALFVEAAARLLADPPRWKKLVRQMQSGKLAAAMRKGEQAPRAAVVCFDCESLVKPGSSESVPLTARNLRDRLRDISDVLGIRLPVYVLFTRLDRIAFFNEYVHNLTEEEAGQAVGATLPMQEEGQGVYAERQGERLNRAFQDLIFCLGEKRTEFLARENDASLLPGAYEFPRELRKVRGAMVNFLIDLCRPSQLAVGPFLRGFYFTGVRPVIIREVFSAAAAQRAAEPRAAEREAGATGMFRAEVFEEKRPAITAQTTEVRKAPQWVFLKQFFGEVLLADRTALGASGASTKTNTLRRALAIGGIASCLLLSFAFLYSFVGNRSLENEVLNAARGLPVNPAGNELPSLDALRRLDTVRTSLETLRDYREHTPLGLRWGLYAGNDLEPQVSRIYFNAFRKLLLEPTQGAMLASLRALPMSPGAKDDAGAYDTLKAYLITTSNHDRSTRLFLAPALETRWMAGRSVDPERAQLAQKQFAFYSEVLKTRNPYSSENDSSTVEHARHYLRGLSSTDQIYRFMLGEARKITKAVNYSAKFPNDEVVDNREVPGEFTKDGWSFLQDAVVKHLDKYVSGEPWVLGKEAEQIQDLAQVRQQIQARYTGEFIAAWRDYLKHGQVRPYTDLKDAVKKLAVTASGQSPLLELFWLASQNMPPDSANATKAFKALLTVMPAGNVDQYVGPTNSDYMKALLTLQVSLDGVAAQPTPNDAATAQALGSASSAKLLTGQMAQGFGVDGEAHLETTVKNLLEAPITSAEAQLRAMGPAEANGKGKAVCSEIHPLFAKYPFSPRSAETASLEDVNALLKPQTGELWTFYEQNLAKMLLKRGNVYEPDPSSGISRNAEWVRAFNRAAAISGALYNGGAKDPSSSYTLRPVASADVESLRLSVDGQGLDSGTPSKSLTWPGPGPHAVTLEGKLKGGRPFSYPTYDKGLWSAFYFFAAADWPASSGNSSVLAWTLRTVSVPSGQPLVVRFELSMNGAPLFRPGYLSGVGCGGEGGRSRR